MKHSLERKDFVKNKKGFTLIELLAVIVILAIIALIAVPVVMNIIENANKSAFKDSAYGIIKAGEYFYTEKLLEPSGFQEEKIFNFPDNIGTLGIKGQLPTSGSMKVNKEGKVEIAISNGKYCITKRYDEEDITITENTGECMFELPTVGSVITYNPVTDKLCSNYTEANSETGVKEGCLRWYVHKVEDNKITLMLDHNTTANIKPISYEDEEIANKIKSQTGKIAYITSNSQMNEDTKNWKAEANSITFEDILYSIPWFINKEDKSDLASIYEEYSTLVVGVAEQIQTQLNPENYETIDEYIDAAIALGNESGLLPKEYMYRDLLKYYFLTEENMGYLTEPFMAEMFDTAWGFLSFVLYSDSISSNIFGLRPVITLDNNYKAINQSQITDIIIEENINIWNGETSNITTYIGPRYIKNDHTKLKYTSNNPEVATVDKNGKITGVSAGNATITVSTTDGSNISKTISVTVEVTYENGIMTSTNNCINSGTCEIGVPVLVKVNNTKTHKFYVINDDEAKNEVTLIMDRNLGEKVAWVSKADYNDDTNYGEWGNNNKGPITALNYLNAQTADWTNIPTIEEYTYNNNLNGTTNTYGYQKLEIVDGKGKLTSKDGVTVTEITGESRARLLTYEEYNTIKTNNSNVDPNWIYGNLSDYNTTEKPYGYWLLSAAPSNSDYGRSVYYHGYMLGSSVRNSGTNGVRPVITLSK